MIEFVIEQKIISLTVEQTPPLELSVVQNEINFEVLNGSVLYSNGLNIYSATLSQIDIDNKFIIVSALANLFDKKNVAVLLDNVGIHLEEGIDYRITLENKILWSGYQLDGKLLSGDKIKVYY